MSSSFDTHWLAVSLKGRWEPLNPIIAGKGTFCGQA